MSDYDLRDPFSNTRVGIVISQLLIQGGGEEVARALAQEFNAPIYTLYYDPQRFDEQFHEDVRPRIRRIVDDEYIDIEREAERAFHDGFLPQTPGSAFGRFDRSNIVDEEKVYADVLIAVDVKGAQMCEDLGRPYISYMHHPGKTVSDYFWDVFDKKPGVKSKLKWLYNRHKESKQIKSGVEAADKILTNSERTRRRTHEVWDTPLDRMKVVYPPVDTGLYQPFEGERDDNPIIERDRYFLAPQRLEPYKNIHIIVEAAKLANEHLIITGSGTMEDYIRREAQHSRYVHMFGYMDEESLVELYQDAEAVVQGAMREDFGLVPVEAMACGTPSIVPGSGGFKETVGFGWNEDYSESMETDYGYLIADEDFKPETLGGVMQNFDKDDYDSKVLRRRAETFDRERFFDQVDETVQHVLDEQ